MLRDGLGSFNWNGKERVWKEEGRRDDGIFGVIFGGFGGFGMDFWGWGGELMFAKKRELFGEVKITSGYGCAE